MKKQSLTRRRHMCWCAFLISNYFIVLLAAREALCKFVKKSALQLKLIIFIIIIRNRSEPDLINLNAGLALCILNCVGAVDGAVPGYLHVGCGIVPSEHRRLYDLSNPDVTNDVNIAWITFQCCSDWVAVSQSLSYCCQ